MDEQNKNLLKSSFIGSFAEAMLMPVYALFVLRVGGDLLDVGYAFAIFSILKGIFVFTFGKTPLFKNNVHLWVMVGFFLSALCDCFYIFVHTKYEFFIVQVIAGLSLGILNPAWEAIYSEADSVEHASEKWSLWNGGVDFSVGFAAILGGLLIKFTSWNCLFIVMSVISLYSTYFSYLVYKNRNNG